MVPLSSLFLKTSVMNPYTVNHCKMYGRFHFTYYIYCFGYIMTYMRTLHQRISQGQQGITAAASLKVNLHNVELFCWSVQ